jgi:hypothetical protein
MSTGVSSATSMESPEVGTIDMKLEVVTLTWVLQEVTTRLPGREWED